MSAKRGTVWLMVAAGISVAGVLAFTFGHRGVGDVAASSGAQAVPSPPQVEPVASEVPREPPPPPSQVGRFAR